MKHGLRLAHGCFALASPAQPYACFRTSHFTSHGDSLVTGLALDLEALIENSFVSYGFHLMLAAVLYGLIVVFSQKTLAERPSRLRVSLAADEDLGEISEIIPSPATASGAAQLPGAGCQQEEALLAALRDLGVTSISDFRGLKCGELDRGCVTWSGCSVTEIRLYKRDDPLGALSDSFLGLPDLEVLRLRVPIRGNPHSLRNCRKLQELRLSGIEGSLISLQNCTSLEILDIADTKVEGDLLSLRNCNFLRELRLYGSQIEGNLTGLQNCTSLERLSLGWTKVGGDLLGLQNCTRLQDLWLDRTRVHGNLNAFEVLRNLEFLDLSHTNTSGELESLRHPPHLERFFVGGTKIKGACLEDFDVRAALGELGLKDPELKNLDLHGTKILKFSQWNDCFLVEINLGGRSDISGRLGKKIQQLEGLVALILKGTKVSGDLQTLKNAKDLERLDLSGTEVTGDIDLIRMLPSLLDVDVSKTRVTGQLNCHHSEYSMKPPLFRTWFKSLNVADTNTSIILSGLLDADSKDNFCSRLVFLDLSGTRVENTSTAGLLECLQLCSSLTTLKVTGCKLTGTLPDIAAWPLANPLMSLDLSSNRLSRVEAIPPGCNTFSVLGNEGISFAPGVLQKAVAESVFLDLRDLTLANAEGATLLAELADQKVVQKTRHRTMVDRTLGYACFDIANPRLQISPQKFAPHELCSCSPGWTGLGISCRACPANSFKEDYDGECQKCPAGSEAPEGSITHQECKCKLGDLFNMTGTWKCGCPVQHVLLEDSCMKCERLHLNCSSPGTEAVSAQPLAGYLRLGNRARAFECLSPNTRCIASNLKASHCHDGYAGQLCMECGPGFYASGGLCEQCTESSAIQSFQSLWQDSGLVLAAVAAVMILALALIACLCWTRPSNAATAQSEMLTSGGSKVLTALKMQLKAQAPLLLQMVQLWSVLAVLATSQSDYTNTFEGGKLPDVANATNTPTNHTSKSFILWELPYVKVVQLSVSNLKGAVNLQCKFDGATVRLAFALAAPVFPLLVLVCCLILEVVNRGAGIAGALQALTLLYVGGASSCADLLSCQDVDGAGETLPKEFVFRKSIPYILCESSSPVKTVVDAVGYIAAVCYGIVIPVCLLYVYARQRTMLRSSKVTVSYALCKGNLRVYMQKLLQSETVKSSAKEDEFSRCLVASAAAHTAVHLHGRVGFQLADGAVVVKPVSVTGSQSNMDLNADLLAVLGPEDAEEHAKTLRCQSLAKMLTERVVLQDIIQSDRVLLGGKQLLLKYRFCQNLWMEIAQKLVAVALVSVVNSADALQFSLGIALTMAATSLMVQPYLQQQVNTLQCFCFVCLGLAALRFLADFRFSACTFGFSMVFLFPDWTN